MVVTLPFLKSGEHGFRQFRFVGPGITFQLFLGQVTPIQLKMLSFLGQERHILMSENGDHLNMQDALRLVARARPVGDLAR